MATMVKDKEAFFRELERLEYPSDGENEDFSGLVHLTRKRCECPPSISFTPASDIKAPAAPPSVRASTEPLLASSGIPDVSTEKEVVTTSEQSPTPAVTRSTSTDVMPRKAKTTRGGSSKRKGCGFRAFDIPEHRQILKGLVFYYLPNDDRTRLRRLQMQRAREYGASRAREWNDTITHVVVERWYTYENVMKHFKNKPIPKNVALVDSNYPLLCIGARQILDATQTRFRVRGAPVPGRATESSPAREPSSNGSLPIKPAKAKRGYIDTQSTDDEADTELFEPEVDEHLESKQITDKLNQGRDALDDVIEEVQAIKDLPIEIDSADEAAAAGDDQTSDSSDAGPAKKKRKTTEKDDWQQNFVCMQKHDAQSNSENPNSHTIAILQQMLEFYKRTNDQWRVLAYRKAISALRRQPRKISTRLEALAIPGIGQRLADKIEEIVSTNRLRQLENATNSREDKILKLFTGIYGVGINQASIWLAEGYKTLKDLRVKIKLTHNQRIGIEHYGDFAQRIPRSEVEEHGEIVRKAVQSADPDMQVIIAGSYRRGAPDCGDIDLLITKPDAEINHIRTVMMRTVIPTLRKQGFLKTSLASSSSRDGSKWHGACALPPPPPKNNNKWESYNTTTRPWRRIDLLFVPDAEIGAALIYFTGNDIFNRSMRLLASRKGMRLNQRGLYTDVLRGPQRAKINEGRLLEGHDERRIFDILGVPWRPPEHRIC
ncbi:DNA polymerase Pol4 [Aspergillus eucalypticola CBS 122712]|uniref:DNA polymerase lambda n=1 Tax=Aspergillus eucalypticola (strain CBS 122712 / IBT 29274) TaxID=1448314 RepID=A0A317V2L1_ASPEC|nr:DNA polymerase Pol4 [Aspergillus eucalypticola CBS 122712]PWY67288.1 DNA polymerase Pol4 [Aspergillus eucalypticola CBS 122712]